MSVAAIRCRQCGSADIRCRGPIARGRAFAGHTLDPVWPGGSLYECAACALVFRAPLAPESVYATLYATAADTVYTAHDLRHDQTLVRDVILEQHPGGRVLDVGCFDGALLDSLGDSFAKFGVEPSQAARKVARGRGVDVIGARMEDIGADMQFDVACAVDVIEHVPQPFAFLAALAQRVRAGGSIVISTGNADARAWRWFGGRYWYCSFPEHLSFISPRWLAAAAPQLKLDVAAVRLFRHRHFGTSHASAIAGFGRRLLAAAAESLAAPALADYRRLGPRFVLGFPGVNSDHLVALLRVRTTASEGENRGA
jgi:SAM-dependent methyltransferase